MKSETIFNKIFRELSDHNRKLDNILSRLEVVDEMVGLSLDSDFSPSSLFAKATWQLANGAHQWAIEMILSQSFGDCDWKVAMCSNFDIEAEVVDDESMSLAEGVLRPTKRVCFDFDSKKPFKVDMPEVVFIYEEGAGPANVFVIYDAISKKPLAYFPHKILSKETGAAGSVTIAACTVLTLIW